GRLEGQLRLSGSFDRPLLVGQVQFKDAALNVELAKARIRLGSQPLVFSSKGIEFKEVEVFDINGNKGVVSSYLLTEDYRNYDLQTEVQVNNFQVLNTTAQDNDLYYGQLLVDAQVKMSGNITAPVIEIITKPQKGSELTYVYGALSNALELHDGIVRFINPSQETEIVEFRDQLFQGSSELNVKIIVKLEVDEALNFTAITDPISGDFFEGKAKGDLVYIQNPDGSLELTGGLEVIEGKYVFTYQKLIRRPFKVKPGGTVYWTGDPFNPKSDIDIQYALRTSVYPLIAEQGESSAYSKKENFIVNLNFSGFFEESVIKTAIIYPEMEGNSNDSDIRSTINQINQDPSMQNTQAMALILFNGFLAQDFANSEFRVVDFTGNINNMISQQLSNLANRYIKFVEFDIGLDSYDNAGSGAQTDIRVSIRKRLLNDRLSISLDGKTTTTTTQDDTQSQTFIDNITLEYAVTPDGRFRVKMYNQRDYDEFIGGTTIKVGGAIVFSKDFSRVRLFRKKE
ncbi:MAG: translocation/assembly module TamB domain-containing protein, partial [Bacteroidota bacterium]